MRGLSLIRCVSTLPKFNTQQGLIKLKTLRTDFLGFPLIRCLSTTPNLYTQQSLVKLKKLQAEFQEETGRLVWERRGSDRILFLTTWVLVAFGLVFGLMVLYDLVKPVSWRRVC